MFFWNIILVYDPDPISSLRRRRISNDSLDSGGCSDGAPWSTLPHQRCPTMAPLSSYSVKTTSTSSPKKTQNVAKKRKRKHHRHRHHCNKHKHKRRKRVNQDDEDNVDRVKLDGSFNNTTTYSIRSPPTSNANVKGKSVFSANKSEEDDDSSDDDDEDLDEDESSEEEEDEEQEQEQVTF